MDAERNYQSLATNPYSRSEDSSVTNGNVPQLSDEEGQKVDLAWLMAVIRRRAGAMAIATFLFSGISGGLILWKAESAKVFYDGSFQVLAEPVTAEGRLAKLSLSAQTGTSVGATELTKVGVDQADLVDYETQIRVLTSPKILTPVVKELRAKYPKLNYTSLLIDLELSRISYVKDGKEVGTKILRVHYRHEDPEKVKFVLDTLAQAYLQYSLQERLTSLRQGVQFIDEQLPELEKRVNTFEAQLQTLRQNYDLSFPAQTAGDLSAQKRNIDAELMGVQAQLEETKASYDNLQEEITTGNPIAILSRDPNNLYGSLIDKLYTVEAQIASQSTQFRESSPPIQVLREKQENLQRLLVEQAEKSRQTLGVRIQDLEARERYLQNNKQQLDRKLDVFPSVLRRYSDLERNVAVATDSLKAFLEKREALQLDASQRKIPWELISPPDLWRTTTGQLMTSSSIDKKRLLAVAVILSLLAGIGVGFIVEILDAVYHTPEEVKGLTKLRLLGTIPFVKSLQNYERQLQKQIRKAQALDAPNLFLPQPEYPGAFREAFRSLYTNISLLGSKQRPIRSLVVSSAAPSEGKSTIALELAQTAAKIGQRVLLIDADLRRSQLHLRLGLKNEKGLSDALQSDLSLNDTIQQAPMDSNLFFLSSGSNVGDPIKLLTSSKMEHLMIQFQGFFDLVIYNSPPLLGLADANLLASNADGIILVVRLEKTERATVMKALEGLKMSRASILGVVANGMKGKLPNPYAIYSQDEVSRQLQSLK
ncbi:GumC family protein [Lusitaniella coriacea]|uniref:GumC family protein n=1 Tax=Lusitaniella coriacea TaxID=1983105 RepID=UPI003CF33C3A